MKIQIGRASTYEPTAAELKPGRELRGHTNRSGTTIHGVASAGFGMIFVVAGATVGMLGWQGKLNAQPGVPLWLAPVFGLLFAIAGLAFVLHGIQGLMRRRRIEQLREHHAHEPWVWDHSWDPTGSPDDSPRRIRQMIWFAVVMGIFMVPFNWISFFSPERPVVFQVVTTLFDLIVLWSVWRACYLVAQRAKYGATQLRFAQFPFAAGEEIEVTLPCAGALEGITTLDATLRCVQERYETRRSGKNRQSVVVSYEVWSARQRAETKRGELVWRFQPPGDIGGTTLSERPPRSWELEVKAETAGIDYAGTFLVPVYEGVRRGRGRMAGRRAG